MAVIFELQNDDGNYQIRTAGQAIRLYTNGVFHSQWNARRPLSGAVWDLLALPVLYLTAAETRPLRVLVLGVGGGAVIRQLQTLAPRASFVGVELDPVHLRLAREYFGVDERCAQLHCDNAVGWLKNYQGPRFDYVIDDLFMHRNGEPERAVAVDKSWAAQLRRVTAKDGVIIANYCSKRELADSALMSAGAKRVYRWSQSGYVNAIGAFVYGKGDAASWRRALSEHGQLDKAQRDVALDANRLLLK